MNYRRTIFLLALLLPLLAGESWSFDLLDNEEAAPAADSPRLFEYRFDGHLPSGKWQRLVVPQLRTSSSCPLLLTLLYDASAKRMGGLCLQDGFSPLQTMAEAETRELPQQYSQRRDGEQRVDVLFNARGTPAFILIWRPEVFTQTRLKGKGVYIQDVPENIAESLPGQLDLAGEAVVKPTLAHAGGSARAVAGAANEKNASSLQPKAAVQRAHTSAIGTEVLPPRALPKLAGVRSLRELAERLQKAPREKLPRSFEMKALGYLIFFSDQLKADCSHEGAVQDFHCPAYYLRFFPDWKKKGYVAFLEDFATTITDKGDSRWRRLIARWKARPVLQQILQDNLTVLQAWQAYQRGTTFQPGEDRQADLEEIKHVMALLEQVKYPNLLAKSRRKEYEEMKKYAVVMRQHLEEVVQEAERERALKALGERIMGRQCETVEWWGQKRNKVPDGEVTLYCQRPLPHGGELVIGLDAVVRNGQLENRAGKIWAYARVDVPFGKDTKTHEAQYHAPEEIPGLADRLAKQAAEDWDALLEWARSRQSRRPHSVSLYRCRHKDHRYICEVRSDLGEEGTLFASHDAGESSYHLSLMGSSHAQAVAGTYFMRTNTLTTTACGRHDSPSIDEAMRLFARCALLRHY